MRRRQRGRWLVGRPDPRAFAPLNSGAPYSYRLLLQINENPTGAAISTQEPPFRDKLSPVTPPLPRRAAEIRLWRRLAGSALGLAVSHAARRPPGPVLVIARDPPEAT